MAFHMLIFH